MGQRCWHTTLNRLCADTDSLMGLCGDATKGKGKHLLAVCDVLASTVFGHHHRHHNVILWFLCEVRIQCFTGKKKLGCLNAQNGASQHDITAPEKSLLSPVIFQLPLRFFFFPACVIHEILKKNRRCKTFYTLNLKKNVFFFLGGALICYSFYWLWKVYKVFVMFSKTLEDEIRGENMELLQTQLISLGLDTWTQLAGWQFGFSAWYFITIRRFLTWDERYHLSTCQRSLTVLHYNTEHTACCQRCNSFLFSGFFSSEIIRCRQKTHQNFKILRVNQYPRVGLCPTELQRQQRKEMVCFNNGVYALHLQTPSEGHGGERSVVFSNALWLLFWINCVCSANSLRETTPRLHNLFSLSVKFCEENITVFLFFNAGNTIALNIYSRSQR